MTIVITKPTEISEEHLQQVIDLVVRGGQIKRNGLKEKILQSDFIAYKIHGNNIICTATLKNPKASYRTKVFNLAKVEKSSLYEKELGYIATKPEFEGQGHCKNLLGTFIPKITIYSIFATTRKPAMVHILNTFGFHKTGKTYSNDLTLLITN